MANDFISKQIPKIASSEVAEAFDQKVRQIDLQNKEKQVALAAATLGLSYIYLVGFPISPETLTLIPEEESRALQAVCFFAGAEGIRVATVDAKNPQLALKIKELEEKHFTSVMLYLISQHSFDSAFKLFKAVPKVRQFVSGVEITEEEILRFEREIKTFQDLANQLKAVSVSDILTLVIAAAIKARASDIHIEAEEKEVKIRFRIDGVLHDAAALDHQLWPKIITRIKLVAKLKINIDDRPQDGRFTIFLKNEKIDVRVSALPTSYGESVVMRLLMSSALGLSFENLGLRGRAFEVLKMEINKPNGMIIATGPTGSGKTTTLYSVLNRLSNPENKIITIEDPIEYKLPGINQSQTDSSKGYTFATGLRSILRQDPDVIMVGEIRDLETAEIAINAALTGHLVITTLHTNDAAGTIPRLLAMNVKPFLIAPAINAMIGQRLVRRICPNCRREIELDNQTMSRVMKILSAIPEQSGSHIPAEQLKRLKFFKGGGCSECQNIGYKGRVGIYEVMVMVKEVEKLLLASTVSEYDMRDISSKYGMVTMVQDGLMKAADGITTVDEVFRVAKDIMDKLT